MHLCQPGLLTFDPLYDLRPYSPFKRNGRPVCRGPQFPFPPCLDVGAAQRCVTHNDPLPPALSPHRCSRGSPAGRGGWQGRAGTSGGPSPSRACLRAQGEWLQRDRWAVLTICLSPRPEPAELCLLCPDNPVSAGGPFPGKCALEICRLTTRVV